MLSVSSATLLCQSSPSRSMNLKTADFWMEAALHEVFAVRNQPKANTLLTWAAHPHQSLFHSGLLSCQQVDNIPHPSLPCSALWLLAVVEVWPSKANPTWVLHLQGMQACVLRAALHSISVVSKQAQQILQASMHYQCRKFTSMMHTRSCWYLHAFFRDIHATCICIHFDSDAKQLCNTLPCVCPTSTCATRRQKLQQAHLSDTAREDFPICLCFWVSTLQGQSTCPCCGQPSCPYWGHDLNTTVRARPHSEGEISDGQISCLHHSRYVGFMGNVCTHWPTASQSQSVRSCEVRKLYGCTLVPVITSSNGHFAGWYIPCAH